MRRPRTKILRYAIVFSMIALICALLQRIAARSHSDDWKCDGSRSDCLWSSRPAWSQRRWNGQCRRALEDV